MKPTRPFSSRKPIIGVMGPANPENKKTLKTAFEIGKSVAEQNWVLLTGGRNTGVMDEASRGAASADGTVIGVLPGFDLSGASPYLTIPIRTGLGSSRNIVNILTADLVIVCGLGLGTTSEAALALKAGKPTGFISMKKEDFNFFHRLNDNARYFDSSVTNLMDWIKSEIS